MTRTSTLIGLVPPTRWKRCSCRTRSTLACVASLISPTASSNTVPPPALVQGVARQERDLFEGERLFDVVVGAQLDRLDRRFDGPVAGHHDDQQARVGLHRALERLDAVEIGHPDVEEHQVRGGISLDELEGFLAALRHGNLVALVLQDARERVEDRRLVVHDQDVVRHGYWRGQTGSSIVKTAPVGTWLPARMRPLWSEMMRCTMASPRPVPVFFLEK